MARPSFYVALFLCAACTEAPSTAPSKASASAAANVSAAHAAVTAKPGSHDDWCEEHGVPESRCTKCNPSLIPVFKANKDWCEEHAMPESQCTLCNPDLKIVRPPKGA